MNFPQRKSPRASWIEYNGGTYFITICTHNKQHYFGSIQNEEIKLSLIGKILAEELNQVSTHYPYIELLQYVVMPNHFHALVNIVDVSHQTDAARCVPTEVRFNKELKEKRLPRKHFLGAFGVVFLAEKERFELSNPVKGYTISNRAR